MSEPSTPPLPLLHATPPPEQPLEETPTVQPEERGNRPPVPPTPVAAGKTNAMRSDRTPRPFPIRHITYYDRRCVIILQEENGPCPLIALCNILSLQGRMDLGSLVKGGGGVSSSASVRRSDLTNALAAMIMDRLETGAGTRAGDSATRRYTFTDALEHLPKFVEGMDLNVKFFNVEDFEASPEVAVLDAAGIELVHGWIVDPEMKELVAEVKPNLSYNAMVEKAMNEQAPLFKEWLDQTASQLTFAGLFALQTNFQEGDIKMLFRNNHYSVLTKRKGTLWSLISDAGMSCSSAIWESMVDVDGQATQIVDASFGERRATPPPVGGHGGIQQGRVVDPLYSPSYPGPQQFSGAGGGGAHQHHSGGRGGGNRAAMDRQERNRQESAAAAAQRHKAVKKKAKDDDCCSLM